MIGTRPYFVNLMKAVLPTRWFGETTPVLDALLNGFSAMWEHTYQGIAYIRRQSRLVSASGMWLDLIGEELFGSVVQRRPDENDSDLRTRIQDEITRERCTRNAVATAITSLTGNPISIFEPGHPRDTGGYRSHPADTQSAGGGVAYGTAGGWGSLTLPFQFFLHAQRSPVKTTISSSGWNQTFGAYGGPGTGFASLKVGNGSVSTRDIYAMASRVTPAAVIAWTKIQ